VTAGRIAVGVAEIVPDTLWTSIDDVPLVALPDARAWSLITRGLESVGQRELMIIIRRCRGESRPPDFPFILFRTLHRLAANGSTVGEGGHTRLAAPVGGGPPIEGFVYEEPGGRWWQEMLPDDHSRPPLLVIPLLTGEIDAALSFGHARVLALLGRQARYYPYPEWFDPARAPVLDIAAYRSKTLLKNFPVLHVPYIQVVRYGLRLEITLPRQKCAALLGSVRELPDAVALLPGFARNVLSTMVWRPGQTQPEAIWASTHAPEATPRHDAGIGVNFLAIIHGDIDPTVVLREDGYALMLSERLWNQFLAALEEGRSLVWDVPDGEVREIQVKLPPNEYHSPFGEIFSSEGAFASYSPAPSDRPPTRVTSKLHNVRMDKVVLLTPQHEIGQAIPIADLAAAIDDVMLAVDDHLDGVTHDYSQIVIQVTLAPNRPADIRVGGRTRDKAPVPLGQTIANRVADVRFPSVARFEVRFQIFLAPEFRS
jgi:hypothetical protein